MEHFFGQNAPNGSKLGMQTGTELAQLSAVNCYSVCCFASLMKSTKLDPYLCLFPFNLVIG